ncbi:MAG: M56 family metallopeptidase, partial [Acidobacteria bacterium]
MTGLSWYLQNLLAYSLQLAVMIGTAALLVKFLPIGAPRLAYAYWRFLLLTCLLLPLIQPWAVPQQPALTSFFVPFQKVPGPEVSKTLTPDAPWQIPYVPLLIGILAAGIVFRASRFVAGALSLRRALERARPADCPASWKVTVALRGVQPQICFVDGVTSPATYGLRRPVILLPPAFSKLTERQQQAVIYHEVRHVERHDWLFRLGEETVRCLFWFHPLVVWLTRRIELSREQEVDQEVVEMMGENKPYLESLMEMANARLGGTVAAVFLTESYLRQRVRLIKEGLTMSKRRLSLSLAVS